MSEARTLELLILTLANEKDNLIQSDVTDDMKNDFFSFLFCSIILEQHFFFIFIVFLPVEEYNEKSDM